MSKPADDSFPDSDPGDEDDERRHPLRRGSGEGVSSRGLLHDDELAFSRGGALLVEPAFAQAVAHLGDELEEAGLLTRVGGTRLREVDVDDRGDPPWPTRHDDDAGREEDRLGDRVRDEDDRRPDPRSRSAAARCSGARVSSRPALRTARPSTGARVRTRAHERSTPAAASLRRAARDGASRTPRARRGSSAPGLGRHAPRGRTPISSSGSAMFFEIVRQS